MPNHFTTVGLCSRRYDTKGNEIEYQTIKEGLEGKNYRKVIDGEIRSGVWTYEL